jgi:hypothetical protein
MTISPHTFAGIPPEEEVGAQQGGGEPGLLRQLGAGLFPTIGAGLVQALLPKGERRGFSEQFIRQTQLMEQRREQQRQRDEDFYRLLIRTKPEIIRQMPEEARQTLIGAAAEPREEFIGGGGGDVSGIRPALEQFVMTPPPLAPGVLANIATSAMSTGDEILANKALGLLHPDLMFSPEEQAQFTPEQVASFVRAARFTEPGSFQNFFDRWKATNELNFDLIDYRDPETQQSVREELSREALAAIRAGHPPDPLAEQALLAVIGERHPETSPAQTQASLRQLGELFALMEGFRTKGTTEEKSKIVVDTYTNFIKEGMQSFEALGILDPDPDAVAGTTTEMTRLIKVFNQGAPAQQDAEIDRMLRRTRRAHPDWTEDEVVDAVDKIIERYTTEFRRQIGAAETEGTPPRAE